MPWRQATNVLERTKFVLAAELGDVPISELCRRYGISRKTGYCWMKRYEAEGLRGLEDRSRRPHCSPSSTAPELVDLVLEQRRRRPHWGPKKLRKRLERLHPQLQMPAESTIALILKRHGVVAPRRRRQVQGFGGGGLGYALEPNALWTVDFKGDFRLGNGKRCYPLTVQDGCSRFLLCCTALKSVRGEEAWPCFEQVFYEMGVPHRIGSDNGSPFGSNGLGGLSKLAIRFIKLGIELKRIDPGHPEQNGRHERMHRTLKAEAVPRRPAAPHHKAQQRHFNEFRVCYNTERPHEALSGQCPGDLYRPSSRSYTANETPGLDYPGHYETRQVRPNGEIKWQGLMVYVSAALIREPVGLIEVDDGVWDLYFGPVLLGQIKDGCDRLTSRPVKRRGNAGRLKRY